ncbi:MAG: transcription antitermination factor NusB, partial [Opitutales bacterium]|nr:transcription antitermination factor NusB [Opitutales bacterium]
MDRIAAFEHRLATRSGAAGESWALDGDDASYRLFAGVVRHHALLSYFLEQSVKRAPKARLKAALMPSIFELYENVGDPGRVARIVHHAVEMIRREFSAREGGFANAVMRTIASGMPEMLVELERTARWSILLSHPEELVKRWMGAFGADRAIDLMKWNQRVPELYAND